MPLCYKLSTNCLKGKTAFVICVKAKLGIHISVAIHYLNSKYISADAGNARGRGLAIMCIHLHKRPVIPALHGGIQFKEEGKPQTYLSLGMLTCMCALH